MLNTVYNSFVFESSLFIGSEYIPLHKFLCTLITATEMHSKADEALNEPYQFLFCRVFSPSQDYMSIHWITSVLRL